MPKVLVVDDAAADRVRVSGIASRWQDCEILQADNGKSALDQIEVHLPDLVLTDLHMPEMNGLELVAAVKEDFPNIPVVLMTAKGSEDIAAEALKTGAASYVPKLRLTHDLLTTMSQVYSSSRASQDHSRLMHYLAEGVVTFLLPNDYSLIRSCVGQIATMIRCVPLGDEAEQLRVSIAIQEAIDNAYYHGNLEVATEAGDDTKRFEAVAQARSYIEPYVHRRIHVTADINRERVKVTVTDDGCGFDHAHLGSNDELSGSPERHGRGIRLMTSAMDEVSFNDSGNQVHLVRFAQAEDEADDDGSGLYPPPTVEQT